MAPPGPPAPPARATLDFFAAQANARRRTTWLVFSFAGALCLVVAFVYAALVVAVATTGVAPSPAGMPVLDPFQPGLLVAATAGVAALTGIGSAYHAVRLSVGGGDAVARMLGGTEIDRATLDPARRRLVNVTEEMAIAAGMPVPRLYALEDEASINAFAAGYTPGHSVVAVTRGALERLNRDELQGVVAHELSHLLHGDTRIDLRLMTAVGGLTFLALIGRLILESTPRSRSRGDGKGRGAILLIGIALLVAGAFGAFCGKLVRYAVSRQREWLADASSVQFTRNPDGLAGALRKIGEEGSEIANPHAPEAAHLFLARSSRGFWSGLFSTHPPIEERIRRLAPALATPGVAPAAAAAAATPTSHDAAISRSAAASPEAAPSPGAFPVPSSTASPGTGIAPGLTARLVVRPDLEHVDHATAQIERIAPLLRDAARGPFGARAIACGLLLGEADADRGRQIAYLTTRDAALGAEVQRLAPAIAALPRPDRTALLGLAVPALDALSPAQSTELTADLRALASGDGKTTPYEWAVQRIATRRLHRDAGKPPPARLRTIEEAGPECLDVLSTLAWLGARDEAQAQASLDAGVRTLGASSRWRLLTRDRLGPDRLDTALTRLDAATPQVKALLLRACTATALGDGRVTLDEAELVRAIAASLGFPIPPLLPTERSG